jgi:hypothetical protein
MIAVFNIIFTVAGGAVPLRKNRDTNQADAKSPFDKIPS